MVPVVKNLPANAGNARDASLIPGSGRFPWRRKWQPAPVFMPEKSHEQRSLVGYSPWGHKELDTTELLTEQQLSNKNQIYINDNSHQAMPSHTQWINKWGKIELLWWTVTQNQGLCCRWINSMNIFLFSLLHSNEKIPFSVDEYLNLTVLKWLS